MSLTFYYAPMSTATLTELVLAELDVPCEKIKLDLKKGETKTPEYLKINPNGVVPTIVHDGTVLWESAALTIYLGETFGVEKKLFPAPGPQRGEAMKWIVWGNATLGEAAGRFGRHTMEWFPADQKNEKAGEAAKKDIVDRLHVLDGALAGKQFLVGDYTLADTHVHSLVDWIRFFGIDMAVYKNLEAWSSRCKARPAYVKIMSAHGAP